MPTYEPAPSLVNAHADRLLEKYHGDLNAAEVTIGYLFAYAARAENGTKRGHAVKHHGWPCKAKVQVNNLEKRAQGMPDATVTIDADEDTGWPSWTDEERDAVLAHELYHLELLRDRDDQIKSDAQGRPRLRCRPHDWECSGFAAIAGRFGEAAPEVQAVRALEDAYGQLLWEFGESESRPRPGHNRQPATLPLSAGASLNAGTGG